ncbi:MAG TPA: glycosyltransferase family 39 protein [Dehalococcoidia bacterium]|nr:glycosyltransferase family 39 protein [Dehalococcoidia bacterium]
MTVEVEPTLRERLLSGVEPSPGLAASIRGWLRPISLAGVSVFLLALALRLALIGYVNPDPRDGRFDDSVWYDFSARSIAAGKGYVWDPTIWKLADGSPAYPNDTEVGPSALWPPGYPAFLAAIYKVTGGSLLAGKVANAALGAATALLAFLIARRLFGDVAGAVAGVLVAFLPSHALFTALTMSEVFFTFLLALTAYLTLQWVFGEAGPRRWQLAALGFLTGVAALTRGELAAFPLVLFLLFLARSRSWRTALGWTALAVVGMSIAFAPWVLRNRIQMDAWIPGTTGVGRVMLQGHNPETDGGPSLNVVVQFESQFADLPLPRREVEANREAQRQALEWALDHPLEEFKLTFSRLALLYRSDKAGVEWIQSNKPWFGREGADRLVAFSNAYYYALVGLAVVGAPAWWVLRRGSAMLVALLPIAYYTLLFGVVFIGNDRYHVPILPFVAVLAAAPVSLVLTRAVEEWRALRAAAVPAEV